MVSIMLEVPVGRNQAGEAKSLSPKKSAAPGQMFRVLFFMWGKDVWVRRHQKQSNKIHLLNDFMLFFHQNSSILGWIYVYNDSEMGLLLLGLIL